MTVGFIGLGRMGRNIVLHLLEKGFSVVAFNRSSQVVRNFRKTVRAKKLDRKFTGVVTIAELIRELPPPRSIFLMVSAGQPVDEVLVQLLDHGLTTGDTVTDMGNSFYKDSVRRYQKLKTRGVNYLDCGTSGGLAGARSGACLMIGGDRKAVMSLSAVWEALAVPAGWSHVGPSGAGHFVKMVHNGIEYGFNESLGEGFAILKESPYELNLAAIARLYSRGSVIRSWLVELLSDALDRDSELGGFKGVVGGGQTGRAAYETAREFGVAAESIGLALKVREQSQKKPDFTTKVISALRKGYGGHQEESTGKEPNAKNH